MRECACIPPFMNGIVGLLPIEWVILMRVVLKVFRELPDVGEQNRRSALLVERPRAGI